jgi:hypothetical protein
VKLRVALKIKGGCAKGRTVRQGGVWRRRVETHKASCLAHLPPVLHFAYNSLVSHSVCNLAKPLRHNNSIVHLAYHKHPPKTASLNSKHQHHSPKGTSCKKMSKSPQDSDIYAQLVARDSQPEPLKKVLAREQANYDCLSCRVMGVLYPAFLVIVCTC